MYFHNRCRGYIIIPTAGFAVAASQLLQERVDCQSWSITVSVIGIINPASFCQSFFGIQTTTTTYEATTLLTQTVETTSVYNVAGNNVTPETNSVPTSASSTVTVTITTGEATVSTDDIVSTVTTIITTDVTLQQRDVPNATQRGALAMPGALYGLRPSDISLVCSCLGIFSPTATKSNPTEPLSPYIITIQGGISVTVTETQTITDFVSFSTVFVPSATITSTIPVIEIVTDIQTRSIKVYDASSAASIECNTDFLSAILASGGGTLSPGIRPVTQAFTTQGYSMLGCCNTCTLYGLNCIAYQYFVSGGTCEVWVGTTVENFDFAMQLICPLGIADGLEVSQGYYGGNVGGFFGGPCDLGGAIVG